MCFDAEQYSDDSNAERTESKVSEKDVNLRRYCRGEREREREAD